MGSQAAAIFGAVYDLIPTLDTTTQVIYGTRVSQLNQDVVGVTGITTAVTRPTLGRVPRSRDEAHTLTVIASVFRPGPNQRAVTERAYHLVDLLAEHLRTGTNPTLGISANIDAWVSGYELDMSTDDEELQAAGRYAAVTATLDVAAFRI